MSPKERNILSSVSDITSKLLFILLIFLQKKLDNRFLCVILISTLEIILLFRKGVLT